MPSSAAAPPSPQEIQRKLSVHAVAKVKPPPVSVPPVSGTESDSDSILTPDPWSMSPSGIASSGASQHPLSSIAERRSGSGEDTEDEADDEGRGGWNTAEPNDHQLGFEGAVIKAGYLWKKGERRKTWKKRWFVLRPAHLAYYKTAAEYQLLRLLDLSDVHSCTPLSLKRHQNAFGVVSPIRTFYLQAKTPEEVQEWVQAIEEARQGLLPPQDSGSAPIPIPQVERDLSHPAATPSPPSKASYITSSDSEDASPSAPRANSPISQTQSIPQSSPSKSTVPAPPKDPSKTILSGYLMKCGSKRRNWRKRWFVLSGEKLMYSASHMDTKPHRQFAFRDILDALEYDLPSHRQHGPPVSSPPVSEPGDSQSHTFKIVTTKKTLLLCAPSEEDEITWLGAVRALIARRGSGGIGGAEKAGAPSADVSPNTSGFSGGGSGGIKAKVRRLSSATPPSLPAPSEVTHKT